MRIAISGAGVAGPALALWLLRLGHEPILIERAPAFRAGGYVIDFWGVGYTVAQRMGVLPRILEAGYKVEEVCSVDSRGRKIGGFRVEAMRRMLQDRFTSLPRGDLAAAVYSAIEDQVETRFGDSIADIAEDPDGLRLGLESGEQVQADLLVGADGLHSKVRELVFGPQEAFEVDLGYRVGAFEVSGYRPRDELVYASYAEPGRSVARFALRDDRTLFLFVFHGAPAEPHDAAGRKQVLRKAFAGAGWETPRILDAMEGVDDIYLDRVSQIRAPSWSKGRVVLIGDAAACVSLLAGEGTGLALTEAYVLAGELARAGGDYALAFRGYEERLRSFVEGKQKSARAFASSFAPRTAFGLWVRNMVMKLMGVDVVARLFIGGGLSDDFDLPDYGI